MSQQLDTRGNHNKGKNDWEHGTIIGLNAVIQPNASLILVEAKAINNRGEIAGIGVPPGVPFSDFEFHGHAFLLIPCDDDHPDVEGCDYSMVDASVAQSHNSASRPLAVTPKTTSSSAPTVNSLRNRWMQRYRLPGLRPTPIN